MKQTRSWSYLPDVNVLLALANRAHVHHRLAKEWFHADPGLSWGLCAFTEAGFLRNVSAPRAGQITMREATAILERWSHHPGYRHFPITADWQTLTAPLQRRLYGTKQVTDAFLFGLVIRENLALVTMDQAILHLAGAEHRNHVLMIGPSSPAPA